MNKTHGPYIVAVANQKGGVAKTTTVISLAGALVRHGREVLVVDLDAQANLTLGLGVQANQLSGAIGDVLLNSASLLGVSRETSIPGLDLVPSNSEMALAERFLPVRPNYETLLRSAIQTSRSYDFILLDCPPSMGAVTLNAMNAANLLIIPSQPEYYSATALKTMMATIRKVRAQHNPRLVYRILITLMDRRNRIHRNLNEQIRATFGEGVFSNVIEIDTKLRESSVAGLPITHYNAHSRSSLQYQALAEELIQHVEETLAKPA